MTRTQVQDQDQDQALTQKPGARDMFGWLVEWLMVGRTADRLLGCWVPTSSKMGPKCTNLMAKSHQDVAPNPSKSRCWGVLRASWEVLRGSWGGLRGSLAPRWPQEPKKLRKSISGPPSWEACWDPKSSKIAPKSDPKGYHFLNLF